MEIWKDVIGYEGLYQVSDLGRVRSVDRYIKRNDGIIQHRKGKIILQTKNLDGYMQVKLCKDGKSRTVRVHRIIAESFIPNPDNLSDVNHIDCDRTNNIVLNLEWLSFKENIKHSHKKGHYKRYGERNSNYKNNTLKRYYEENPHEKQKLSRKGKQNGMCKKIKLLDKNKTIIKEFDYIGECVDFMISENNWDLKVDSVRNTIRGRIRKGVESPYRDKYYFEIA